MSAAVLPHKATGNGLMFDMTVTLGALLTIATTAIGVLISSLVFVWAMRTRLDIMDVKMGVLTDSLVGIRAELSGIKQLLEITTRQDERLKTHDEFIKEIRRDIYELRHGAGFALPLDYADRLERAEISAKARDAVLRKDREG